MIFPENFCLDVGRSTTRGHDTQAAAAALHVFLIKLHVLEGNRDLFFGVRRKTWRLGRFLSLSILHFAFFVGHGLFFYPNPAHVEPEHQTQQKNYHVFRSTVIRSHCQTFGFVKTFHLFSKKTKKTSQNGTTLQTSSPVAPD